MGSGFPRFSLAHQFTGVTTGRSPALSVEWVARNELLCRVVGMLALVSVKCLEKWLVFSKCCVLAAMGLTDF